MYIYNIETKYFKGIDETVAKNLSDRHIYHMAEHGLNKDVLKRNSSDVGILIKSNIQNATIKDVKADVDTFLKAIKEDGYRNDFKFVYIYFDKDFDLNSWIKSIVPFATVISYLSKIFIGNPLDNYEFKTERLNDLYAKPYLFLDREMLDIKSEYINIYDSSVTVVSYNRDPLTDRCVFFATIPSYYLSTYSIYTDALSKLKDDIKSIVQLSDNLSPDITHRVICNQTAETKLLYTLTFDIISVITGLTSIEYTTGLHPTYQYEKLETDVISKNVDIWIEIFEYYNFYTDFRKRISIDSDVIKKNHAINTSQFLEAYSMWSQKYEEFYFFFNTDFLIKAYDERRKKLSPSMQEIAVTSIMMNTIEVLINYNELKSTTLFDSFLQRSIDTLSKYISEILEYGQAEAAKLMTYMFSEAYGYINSNILITQGNRVYTKALNKLKDLNVKVFKAATKNTISEKSIKNLIDLVDGEYSRVGIGKALITGKALFDLNIPLYYVLKYMLVYTNDGFLYEFVDSNVSHKIPISEVDYGILNTSRHPLKDIKYKDIVIVSHKQLDNNDIKKIIFKSLDVAYEIYKIENEVNTHFVSNPMLSNFMELVMNPISPILMPPVIFERTDDILNRFNYSKMTIYPLLGMFTSSGYQTYFQEWLNERKLDDLKAQWTLETIESVKLAAMSKAMEAGAAYYEDFEGYNSIKDVSIDINKILCEI